MPFTHKERRNQVDGERLLLLHSMFLMLGRFLNNDKQIRLKMVETWQQIKIAKGMRQGPKERKEGGGGCCSLAADASSTSPLLPTTPH
jgi:hypothetical protein